MILAKNNLLIRNAVSSDAEQLCIWWNDGKVMAHAGFPNGLGTTPDDVRRDLAADCDETHRRHIIELDSVPVGEMNYRNKGGGVAEIGLKICDFSKHEQGLGTTLLTMFIDALFTYYGYESVILDTNTKNTRAQRVYEKLGFTNLGVRQNSWKDQVGEWQSSIDYRLEKKDWRFKFDYIRLRNEEQSDYHTVEELTREVFWAAFWEPSRKICDEHLLVHRMRQCLSYVPELDFIAEVNGKIVGHIIYMKSKIVNDTGQEYETLTFGPLSVLPEYQSQGIGMMLLRFSLNEAKRLGYRAVLIFGHPDYYTRVGFRRANEFGVTTADGKTFDPFMVYPLYEGALDGLTGRYYIDPVYEHLTEPDAIEFDKRFPPKEPFTPAPMNILLDRLGEEAGKAVEGTGCLSLQMMTTKSEREISELPGITADDIKTIRTVLRENGVKWGKSLTELY